MEKDLNWACHTCVDLNASQRLFHPIMNAFHVVVGDTFVPTNTIYVPSDIGNATVSFLCVTQYKSLIMLLLSEKLQGGNNKIKSVQNLHPAVSIFKALSQPIY